MSSHVITNTLSADTLSATLNTSDVINCQKLTAEDTVNADFIVVDTLKVDSVLSAQQISGRYTNLNPKVTIAYTLLDSSDGTDSGLGPTPNSNGRKIIELDMEKPCTIITDLMQDTHFVPKNPEMGQLATILLDLGTGQVEGSKAKVYFDPSIVWTFDRLRDATDDGTGSSSITDGNLTNGSASIVAPGWVDYRYWVIRMVVWTADPTVIFATAQGTTSAAGTF